MTTKESPHVEIRRSFGWRMVAAALGMASAFLLTVIIVRTLDTREAATFFAIVAALSIGPMVGRLGLGPNVIRLIPGEADANARRRIAGTHLQATFLLSCASAPVIAFVGCNGLIGLSNFVPAFVLTTLLIITESTRLMVSDIFAAVGRVHASVATMHYIRSFLALPFVAFVVFTLGRPSLLAVLATYLAVAFVQLTVALWHGRSVITFLGFADSVSTVRTAIGQGLLIFGLDFSEFMMMQGTIWLATAAFLPLEATQYAAAVTLAMQVTVLESLSALAVVPPAARLWAAGRKDQVARTLSNAATLNAAVVFVVLALLALFGPFALELAYGHAMRPAATMLMILAASAVFQAFFNRSITMLIVSGHIKEATRTALVVLVLALPCAITAAWLGGPIVLAVVTAVAASAMPTCQWLTARKVLGQGARANYDLVRAVRELARNPDA